MSAAMTATPVTLAALLAHPAIWRGGDCAPEPAALPSGFAALDAVLPGRGWPQGALTEMLLEREGIGEIADAARARARAGAGGATSCGSRRRTGLMRRRSPRPVSISRGLHVVQCREPEGCALGVRPGTARAGMRRRVRVAAHP